MEALPAIRSFDLSSVLGPAFFTPRPHVTSPNNLFFCRAKFVAADSSNAGSHNFGVAPANLLVAEKENAMAVLTLFLKKRGFSKAVAARTVNKSALFIDHLVSRLHSVHKTRHLVGPGLTSLEIRDALNPYLETLYKEFGDILIEVVENFPNPPIEERSTENLSITSVEEGPVVQVPAPITTLNSKQLNALARLTDYNSTGKPPPQIIYLTELGMEIEVIKKVTRKFPNFAYYSLDGKIKPLVEFLLDLGVTKSDIPTILRKRPELCGFSLSKNLIPTVRFLESLGMDKKQWPKVIYRFPSLLCYSLDRKIKPLVEFLLDLGVPKSDIPTILRKRPELCGFSLSKNLVPTVRFLESLGMDKKQWPKVIYRFPSLTYSRQKLKSNLDCLYELGLSTEQQGKVLTRSPNILGFGVEKLRSNAQYFHSIGADVGTILHQCPQLFRLSIEGNLKLVTEFFLERGFSMEEVAFMVSRFGNFYALNLSNNIIPKWEFFLTMGYLKSDLVKYPHYFGYSLELRIKPRYAILVESGVTMCLGSLLSLSDDELDNVLKRKMEEHVG